MRPTAAANTQVRALNSNINKYMVNCIMNYVVGEWIVGLSHDINNSVSPNFYIASQTVEVKRQVQVAHCPVQIIQSLILTSRYVPLSAN